LVAIFENDRSASLAAVKATLSFRCEPAGDAIQHFIVIAVPCRYRPADASLRRRTTIAAASWKEQPMPAIERPANSSRSVTDQEALEFHSRGRPGKIEIVATKPMATQRDLSLAYSPGVAVPVLAIAENPAAVFDYTSRGNLVAVISNGTAILGLGNLGALASKPVMEGKAVLFKRFADVDSIDLEVDTEDVDAFVNAVRYLGPSFGGINLEDIKAPDCFIIEQRLRELMDIPAFHDDQHGTAIIALAGLINALHLTGRDIRTAKLVCNGAGSAAIACIELIKSLGMPIALSSSRQAMPAEPAPLQTSFTVFMSRPVRSSALITAATVMIAVPCWSSWNTGMFISSRSRCSMMKQSGALMSSRFIPPKAGAR
jgi:hypothetical protein